MNVEKLHPSELDRLLPIGEAFSEEAGLPAFSLVSFRQNWTAMMAMGMGEIYVLEEHGRIIGAIGFSIINDTFTGRKTAMESFWFVEKEHRASGAGLLLLDVFEERARCCQDILIVHLVSTGATLSRLYEKRGYTLVEQSFKKSMNQEGK